MNLGDYLQFVIALALVLALIAVLAWLAKRAGYGGGLAQTIKLPAERRRLAVVEVLPLDPRRKLVLLRAGEREHLLLLNHGQGPDLVVDSRSTGSESGDAGA